MNRMKGFLTGLLTVLALVVLLAAWIALPWFAVLGLAVAIALWLFLTRSGRLAREAAKIGIAGLPQRWGASAVIVVGIAGVVGVLVAMLAMGEGFKATLDKTGSDDSAIVLRAGSQAETNSVITRDQAPLLSALPGIAKGKDGKPLASPELSQVVNLPTMADGTDANVQFRGIGPAAWELRPQVKIVQGRKFGAGLRELVVGRGAQKQFRGLDVGKQSEGLTRLIKILGTVIGTIMAIGAVFGALNTMYAAVAGRAREIATMRALGFRGVPVVTAVMLETMLLALLGGLLGAGIAWLLFNGYTVSTLGNNFSQVVFQFRVSPELLWTGLKWALGIGLVGGLFPALRAARLPVTEALRAA